MLSRHNILAMVIKGTGTFLLLILFYIELLASATKQVNITIFRLAFLSMVGDNIYLDRINCTFLLFF